MAGGKPAEPSKIFPEIRAAVRTGESCVGSGFTGSYPKQRGSRTSSRSETGPRRCRRRRRALAVAALAGLLVSAPGTVSRAAGLPHHRRRGIDARVVGSFEMRARVTVAVNVRGERVGELLHRRWKIVPERCRGSVCRVLRLDRERSAGRHDRLTLRRVGSGYYIGTGVFYVGLRCQGRVYRRASRVPFEITLTVRRVVIVQGIAFAKRITATYDNAARSDSTPCPLGPSHDSGRYSGTTTVPSPPVASFTFAVNARSDSASFSDMSAPGLGGARIVALLWSFGDPNSGAQNTSTLPDPGHQFSTPGIYSVILTAIDANGLSSTSSSQVVAPGPPTAGFTDAEQGTSATFSFQDGSTAGIGNAPIVAWQWDFGDPGSGSQDTSSAQNPTHAFSAPGVYTVTLTVTDANGFTSSASAMVTYSG